MKDSSKVRNRDNGVVGYRIPDLGNLNRSFQPNEVKEIPLEELKKLSYIPGGGYILDNYLIIEDEEIRKQILSDVEPEYFFTEKEVEDLLLNQGLDRLLDALDFAPNGVIELIKQKATDLKINDLSKRQAIFEKTGYNITSAVEINEDTLEEEEEKSNKKVRRVILKNDSDQPKGRRVIIPSKKE